MYRTKRLAVEVGILFDSIFCAVDERIFTGHNVGHNSRNNSR